MNLTSADGAVKHNHFGKHFFLNILTKILHARYLPRHSMLDIGPKEMKAYVHYRVLDMSTYNCFL
jgi:hypothetical protein